MVSIEDVAKRAGVSVATVSRALRGLPNVATETRRRVEAAARELDYVSDPSASRLAAGRTKTLGIVVPNLGSWYSGRMMAAVHGVWHEAGYDLLAIVLSDQFERDRFVRDLPFRKRVDGLLLMDVPFDDHAHRRLLAAGTAVVGAGMQSELIPTIGIDDQQAARALVEHLVALGHEDLALISGSIHDPFEWVGPTARMEGVHAALQDAGIDVPAEWSVETDWSAADGAAAMGAILDAADTPPTGVICFSDELAIAAMGVLRRRGLAVPDDVSVVGFDDHDFSEHIGLTTVHQPVGAVGRRAAALLLEQLEEPTDGVGHEVLPTRLEVRSTSGRPRGGGQ